MNTVTVADEAAIQYAADLLRQGNLVAFPTETVYGLGADALNPSAVKRIFAAKGRPANHPLIVHIASAHLLSDWAVDVPDAAYQLAAQFWPGPLAIIVNKRSHIPNEVTGGQDTVGLRVPNHPIALKLLHTFSGGIAAPSANRFCRISPTQAQHVAEELGRAVELILDGGACQVGVESTIIDLTGKQPRLLRPGQISVTALEEVLQTKLLTVLSHETNQHVAPGMMAVHYAPSTPAILCSGADIDNMAETWIRQGKRVGKLLLQSSLAVSQEHDTLCLPAQAEDYAQGLYAALRILDNWQLGVILIEQPPTSMTWQAVNDRLRKATHRA